MKSLLLLASLSLVLPAAVAEAGDAGHPWRVLVIDKDPKGTHIRESPAGNVIKVIARQDGGSPRLVEITGQSGAWFKVESDGTAGWMHGSVLGTCTAGTEDGAPVLLESPRNDSPVGAAIPAGAPVRLRGMHGQWLHVGYTDAKGKRYDGWLPEQALAMSESEREACAKAWARR